MVSPLNSLKDEFKTASDLQEPTNYDPTRRFCFMKAYSHPIPVSVHSAYQPASVPWLQKI